ncbi:MAG: DUF975 family protein [Lachnospiraceae bacterium]|nr:DUF975 family protein [Lachnospiraceae bacterium]
MWNRELLKNNAKDALRRYYLPAFLVCLVTALLCGGANVTIHLREGVEESLHFFRHMDFGILLGIFSTLFMASVISTLFHIFVGNVLEVGSAKFFVESRNEGRAAPLETVLAGFTNDYGKTVITLFLRNLYIALWSLLFVIPGIVKAFEYRMLPYILADYPDITRQDAFALSRRLMDGHKMEAFLLQISFIGWYMLGALLFGIGVYFVYPYVEATFAEFYTALKETTPL